MGGQGMPDATERRAARVYDFLSRKERTLQISTVREALSYGDQWRTYAHRMEALLALATAQRDASDLLLRMAQEEVERLRALLA